MQSIEVTALNLVAIGLTVGILLVVADTPAYPLAIGIEVVVILYYLLQKSVSTSLVQNFGSFISNPGGVVAK